MVDETIIYTRLEPVQIVFIKTRIDTRDQIPPLFERLRAACGDAINGPAMAIFHSGAIKDGFLVEAAYPVRGTEKADTNHPADIKHLAEEVHTRLLEAAPALTILHHGPHQSIRETILKVYEYLSTHAWTTSLLRREIYRVLDPTSPENNLTEIQIILHEWERLLAEGAVKVLGVEARRNLMQGVESITPASSFDDYNAWIQGAIERLDAWTDSDELKCQVVSHCAHVFPQERIDHLRTIYEGGGIDHLLHEMYKNEFWYGKPVRRGNILYIRKNPYDPEGYAKAATPAERRKAYCHCSFVHPYLDEIPARLSPTFCFCGAGWYRRLWEGILGQPVKIEHVETLLRGNEQCTLTVTLPLDLVGEYSPGIVYT